MDQPRARRSLALVHAALLVVRAPNTHRPILAATKQDTSVGAYIEHCARTMPRERLERSYRSRPRHDWAGACGPPSRGGRSGEGALGRELVGIARAHVRRAAGEGRRARRVNVSAPTALEDRAGDRWRAAGRRVQAGWGRVGRLAPLPLPEVDEAVFRARGDQARGRRREGTPDNILARILMPCIAIDVA